MSRQKSPATREAALRQVAEKRDRDQKEANQLYRFKIVRLKKPKA